MNYKEKKKKKLIYLGMIKGTKKKKKRRQVFLSFWSVFAQEMCSSKLC